ncbi:hypothetical protein ACFSMW_10215 [Virgibacillus halophilus]|uniref:t-SNARE coiled-coil homology domain-containing protein n=1 Tax=Tigheibacillus halophilus TaxID=361280 RepID=A0ABU5C430_9BACI|nr:hypothetical protein [Virgibacillus halophilus]
MLEGITVRFDGVDKQLSSMDKRFDGIDARLDGMDKRLDTVTHRLDMQGETLKEHGQMLRPLQTGQEHLKAEIDGIKLSNEREFSSLKESLAEHNIKLDLLHEDTWEHKVDIRRIKKTMAIE